MKLSLLLLAVVIAAGLLYNTQQRELVLEQRWPQVSAVVAKSEGDGTTLEALRITLEHAEDCGDIATEVHAYPHNLDIQLTARAPAAADCAEGPTILDVALESARPRAFLSINDQVWRRDEGSGAPQFVELSRFPLRLDAAELLADDSDDGRPTLRLRGAQSIGCPSPALYAFRETEAGPALGAFNALATETVCPDALVEIDEIVTLPATDAPAAALLSVNGYAVTELESQSMSESDKVLTNIMRVDVTVRGADPARISLAVEGEHPDGCDYPVLVGQTREGETIQVEVYREVPADVICPMILRPYSGVIELDGAFAAGAYTIAVNSHSQTIDI